MMTRSASKPMTTTIGWQLADLLAHEANETGKTIQWLIIERLSAQFYRRPYARPDRLPVPLAPRGLPPEQFKLYFPQDLLDDLIVESTKTGNTVAWNIRKHLAESYQADGLRIDWLNLTTPRPV